MVTIKIIIGSVRPNRFGPQVAHWLFEASKEQADARFELVDLKDVNLPFLDEPDLPSAGNYQNEHTKKWASIIGAADGFVLVHPEYNHGVSPALKNALDFLWAEWNDKPVAFVGYGAEAGGARAAEQLRTITAALKMFDIRAQVAIANYEQFLDENGVFQPQERHIRSARALLRDIAFWAAQMQRARAEYKQLSR